MSTTGMALQYYCPKEYCEDVFKWRLALRNISSIQYSFVAPRQEEFVFLMLFLYAVS